MSSNENGNLRPDGVSASIPIPLGRIGATYYWRAGSPTAPQLTFTRTYGLPGGGLHAVFLRPGINSGDTLGDGMSGNVSTILPSVTVNSTVPDDGSPIPNPLKSRVTTVETGIGTPNASPGITKTVTPQQVADFLNKYLFGPGMGPDDELSPFARTLQSGQGTVGVPDASTGPIRYLGSRRPGPLGEAMGDWRSSANVTPQPAVAAPQPQPDRPGGLLGLLLNQTQDN